MHLYLDIEKRKHVNMILRYMHLDIFKTQLNSNSQIFQIKKNHISDFFLKKKKTLPNYYTPL